MTKILSIQRFDGKIYSIGDTVTSDNFYRGVIDGFEKFTDGFRVHLQIDEESYDKQYFSINELD